MKHSALYEAVFGEKYQPETYKMVDHSWHFSKIIGKSYCSRCGLVNTSNKFTQWAVQKGCMNDLHPAYQSKRRKLK